MIRILKSASLWVKLRKAYLSGDYPQATELAARYRAEGVIDPVFEALDATLDVLTNRSQLALEKFLALENKIKGSRRRNSKYIENYSLFYINLIRGEDGDVHRKLALQSRASNHVRRALPLPEQRVSP